MKVRVTRNYRTQKINWKEGDILRLNAEFVAWCNRDCPGVLVPFEDEPIIEERVPEAPPADRMARGKSKRSKAHERKD